MNQFKLSLSNFITDAAAGGAVRHLADLGFSPEEITEKLDYPVPKDTVAKIMWKHFIDTGIICEKVPDIKDGIEKVTYVKETGKYGRSYLRRVACKVDLPSQTYIKCEFGKLIYKNSDEFKKAIAILDKKDKDYLLSMPWPLTPVYHMENDRIKRITKSLYGN